MKRISYVHDFEKWANEFEFNIPIKVRFSETDMFGHLNNTVPFIYFEHARIELLTKTGLFKNWNKQASEAIPVVADLQCDFLQQVYFDEELSIYVKVNHIGNSSIDLHYMGKKSNGTIPFTGRGVMVKLNKRTGKGEAWNSEELTCLKQYYKVAQEKA